MHFDDQSIGSYGDSGAGTRRNQALLAGSVRGIGDHRKMREIPGERDGCEIESISHLAFKGLDTALAQHNLMIAAGEKIFGRKKPFFYRGGRAALQQDRLVDGGEAA